MADEKFFPQIKKGLEDFIHEEEGNISRSKVAMIGSMMVILGVMLADGNAYAAHRSHSSHRSQSSHSSGWGSHESHQSHQSHTSHSSSTHSSHGSHSSGSHSSGSGTSGNKAAKTTNNYNVKLPKMQTPKPTPKMQ
ncbi:MAG: hypothetical protein HP042_03325 [Lachnospiraceae bacterium]|nr:hypothetical protein [Lachnospiraceae bacterium]